MAKKIISKETNEDLVEQTNFEVANCDLKQIDHINIESLLRVIRSQQVMLDSDLAMLYGDETAIRLRSQIATLNEEELSLRSQIVTLNDENDNLKSQIVTSRTSTRLS